MKGYKELKPDAIMKIGDLAINRTMYPGRKMIIDGLAGDSVSLLKLDWDLYRKIKKAKVKKK